MSGERDPGKPLSADDPVTLLGLDPLEALRGLLAVDPDSEPAEDKPEEAPGD